MFHDLLFRGLRVLTENHFRVKFPKYLHSSPYVLGENMKIIFSIKLFALWYLNFVSPWYIFIRLERKLLIILYHETRAFFYNWPIIYINAIAAASWLLEKGLCLKRFLRSDSVIQAFSDHVSLSLLFQEVTRESSFKSLANSNSSLHERENHLDRCHKFSKDLICHTGLVSG
jgi:hypothetical protein